jgi:hypothetical protein
MLAIKRLCPPPKTASTGIGGSKKEVVFSYENSTILSMPKPLMTQADVQEIMDALKEKHSAEEALQRACLEQRPTEEIDQAISKFHQTSEVYRSLGAKFFENWPG